MLRRVLDDRGRIFGKINIVDLLVLVIIVAIVAFAGVRFSGGGTAETVPVKVTLVDSSVDKALVAGMQNKGTLRDGGGNVIGQVESIQVAPSMQEMLTNDGQYKSFASSSKSDVTFVVKANGTVSESTVHIGSLAVRVGEEVRIVGPGYEAQTRVANVIWGAEALK
jgi:hypothetical protein